MPEMGEGTRVQNRNRCILVLETDSVSELESRGEWNVCGNVE